MPKIANHGYYEPLTSTEQDVLHRLVEGQDLYIEVEGWGYHSSPTFTVGDKRLQIRFPMQFVKPEGVSVPIRELTLILRHRNGRELLRNTESTVYNYQPLWITAGMQVDMVWELSLDGISDELQNMVLPRIQGKRVSTIKDGKVVKGE